MIKAWYTESVDIQKVLLDLARVDLKLYQVSNNTLTQNERNQFRTNLWYVVVNIGTSSMAIEKLRDDSKLFDNIYHDLVVIVSQSSLSKANISNLHHGIHILINQFGSQRAILTVNYMYHHMNVVTDA